MEGMKIETLSALFKSLSEPIRIRIIYLLMQKGELCVCDIVDALGLSQALVSRHLAYLRRNNLVQARQQGVWVHYQITQEGSHDLTNLFTFLDEQAALITECQNDIVRLEKASDCC